MEKEKRQTCIQTSLESPRTRMCLYPFLRACFKPKITARYSATLFVAMPTPSLNRQTYQASRLERATFCKRAQKPKTTRYFSVNCIPYFHLQHTAQLLHQLVQDFLLKHHQTPENRNSEHKDGRGILWHCQFTDRSFSSTHFGLTKASSQRK